MLVLLSALLVLSTVRTSKSDELVIFDNFDHGVWNYGSEEQMVDYAVLALDRKMDLPPLFTICSSVQINFMTVAIWFYQLYQDDGKPWFNMMISDHRDLKRFQEEILRFLLWNH